jgi:DMSO/TMAO reductase YedYZ molybdopterin-dependent catalytic subunit
LRELLRSSNGVGLPPGQRAVSEFPRFSRKPMQGLPSVPANPKLHISGAVTHPLDVALADLQQLPRAEHVADFNCVTTWCVRDLRWGGVSFRGFLNASSSHGADLPQLSTGCALSDMTMARLSSRWKMR